MPRSATFRMLRLACLISASTSASACLAPRPGATEQDPPETTAPDASPNDTPPRASEPCLTATPAAIDFGSERVGAVAWQTVTLTSCSDRPVTIESIGWQPGSAATFSLDLAPLATAAVTIGPGGGDALDGPIAVAPHASVSFNVAFRPASAAAWDPDWRPIPERALLRVIADAAAPLDIAVRGSGTSPTCATPVLTVREGDNVPARMQLHLDGTASHGTGPIREYHWTVAQPVGAQGHFEPSDAVAAPTFVPDVVGTYTFALTVTDASGQASCTPATATVAVCGCDGLAVHLSWVTPGAPMSADGEPLGADLDLHVANADASGPDRDGDGLPDPWFDAANDIYAQNPTPAWNNDPTGQANTPHVDAAGAARDETIWFDFFVDTCLEIGVHARDDHGLGTSVASLDVYAMGNGLLHVDAIEVPPGAMWWAARVCAYGSGGIGEHRVCSGTHAACGWDSDCDAGETCGPRVTLDYPAP